MSVAFRLLYTASRTWDDRGTVFKALDALAFGALGGHFTSLIVVHGACYPKDEAGNPVDASDRLADLWVRRWSVPELQVSAERHPANWKAEGRAAGMLRNRRMVARQAHVCVAFIRGDSPGATGCAELASDAEIPLVVYRYCEKGVFTSGAGERYEVTP